MQQTDAGSRERERQRKREKGEMRVRDGESSSQATGGFRSMHPYARLPTRVRRPASSPDVILPYPRTRVIPPFPTCTPPTWMQWRQDQIFKKWIGPPSVAHRFASPSLKLLFLLTLLNTNFKKARSTFRFTVCDHFLSCRILRSLEMSLHW